MLHIVGKHSSIVLKRISLSSTATSVIGTLRLLHSSSRHGQWQFIVAEAHQSKPEYKLPPPSPNESARRKQLRKQFEEQQRRIRTFSKNSPILTWKDGILKSPYSNNRKLGGSGTSISPNNNTSNGSQAMSTIISPGHDFFFIESLANNSGLALGLADGVGGWEEQGIDPALFSQSLMYYSALSCQNRTVDDEFLVDLSSSSFASSSSTSSKPQLSSTTTSSSIDSQTETSNNPTSIPNKVAFADPVQILDEAFNGVLNEPDVLCGSSTACIVVLDGRSGQLSAANLGDSSFLIFRSNSIIHYQPPQTHYFNCPRQLSKADESSLDLPSHADQFDMNLRHNDIIMLATDGILDNVWPHELETIVKTIMADQGNVPDKNLVHKIAQTTVQYAKACSYMEKKRSPFEAEAKRHGYNHPGGKVDDCTVITAMVLES